MTAKELRWEPISCEDRESLVSRNGERYKGFKVAASRTDLSGQYGEAEVFTEWYDETRGETSVLRDHLFPDPRAVDHPMEYLPDSKPCKHYRAVASL